MVRATNQVGLSAVFASNGAIGDLSPPVFTSKGLAPRIIDVSGVLFGDTHAFAAVGVASTTPSARLFRLPTSGPAQIVVAFQGADAESQLSPRAQVAVGTSPGSSDFYAWSWISLNTASQSASEMDQAVRISLGGAAAQYSGLPLYASVRIYNTAGARTMRTATAPSVFDGSGPELLLTSAAGPFRHVQPKGAPSAGAMLATNVIASASIAVASSNTTHVAASWRLNDPQSSLSSVEVALFHTVGGAHPSADWRPSTAMLGVVAADIGSAEPTVVGSSLSITSPWTSIGGNNQPTESFGSYMWSIPTD